MLIWIILASPYVALLGMVLWDSRETPKGKSVWSLAGLIGITIIVLVFHPQIAERISSMKSIKIDASKHTFEAEFADAVQTQIVQVGELERDTQAIVDAASTSPDKSIALAWGLIERKIRRLLAASHWNNGVYVNVTAGIETLVNLGVLAKNGLINLRMVEDEHNRVLAHHTQGDKAISASAIITAIQLLKGLYSIGLQENIVEVANVALYSDEACKAEISGVTGIMVKQIMIEGLEIRYGVFPTTRTDYRLGEHLTWDWNMSRIWQPFWYRNPKTGAIEKSSAAEFVGSDIDSL
jgi:hypothetical protein